MAQLDQIAPALVGNAESEDGVVDIQRAGAIDLGCRVGEETSFDRALRRYISRSHLERSRRGLLRASRIHPLKSLIQFCRVGAFDPLLHGSVPFFDVYGSMSRYKYAILWPSILWLKETTIDEA